MFSLDDHAKICVCRGWRCLVEDVLVSDDNDMHMYIYICVCVSWPQGLRVDRDVAVCEARAAKDDLHKIQNTEVGGWGFWLAGL